MTTYYTKDQAEMILREWGIGEKLPRKGMQVGVQWAGGKQPNHCTITVAESKSTYGNTLYQFQFENRSLDRAYPHHVLRKDDCRE